VTHIIVLLLSVYLSWQFSDRVATFVQTTQAAEPGRWMNSRPEKEVLWCSHALRKREHSSPSSIVQVPSWGFWARNLVKEKHRPGTRPETCGTRPGTRPETCGTRPGTRPETCGTRPGTCPEACRTRPGTRPGTCGTRRSLRCALSAHSEATFLGEGCMSMSAAHLGSVSLFLRHRPRLVVVLSLFGRPVGERQCRMPSSVSVIPSLRCLPYLSTQSQALFRDGAGSQGRRAWTIP